MNRRAFLGQSGALIVGFSIAALADRTGLAPERLAAQRLNGSGNPSLDGWIAIHGDGRVTAFTGKCELGQGLYTAQTQLVAEELCVPFDRVTLIQCDTALTPDQGTTSGAQSHPTNFNNGGLAEACATAREALVSMAATRFGVPPGTLTVKDGVIRGSGSGQSVSYGELIGDRKFNLPLNPAATRRPSRDWTVLGQPIHRVEIPDIVTGRFEYVQNVRVPGMRHGRVVRPPTFGATVAGVDERSVGDLPGHVKVVVRKNFVGVVADTQWQAAQAATKLRVTWMPGPALPSEQGLHDRLRTQTPRRDTLLVDAGDVDAVLTGAARTIAASYRHPYQMHASMGTACAVADVQQEHATIWSATQAVYPLRSSSAMLLGLDPENVHVIFKEGPGCYGCNGADTAAYDAALLSQAAGQPVRVQLTRRDEMAWENYGVAIVIDQRAALDAQGNIAAWSYEAWSPVKGGRPGSARPGNVVTGMLAGFETAPFQARTPPPPPARYGNNSNAVPPYVSGLVRGTASGTGSVPIQRVLSHTVPSIFFTGPLRSPERLQNTFAHESFIDEIAASVGVDSMEYRLRHLRDPRLIAVVKAAAQAAEWETRKSPQRNPRTGVARGRGMSCVLYEGDNSYVAAVAEVDVNQDTGHVAVRRLVLADDSGPISNPDGLKNQLEGGALQGVSRALQEEVTWNDHEVTSVDWRTYKPIFLGAQVPSIEVVLINQPEGKAMGAGEAGVTIAAGAIANAIFDATGARVRQVPFTPERVKAALAARA
jgi:CO/xanthine dehydrogenase Mo-binding subunit